MACIAGALPISLSTKHVSGQTSPTPMASTNSSVSDGLSSHQGLLFPLEEQAEGGWELTL